MLHGSGIRHGYHDLYALHGRVPAVRGARKVRLRVIRWARRPCGDGVEGGVDARLLGIMTETGGSASLGGRDAADCEPTTSRLRRSCEVPDPGGAVSVGETLIRWTPPPLRGGFRSLLKRPPCRRMDNHPRRSLRPITVNQQSLLNSVACLFISSACKYFLQIRVFY